MPVNINVSGADGTYSSIGIHVDLYSNIGDGNKNATLQINTNRHGLPDITGGEATQFLSILPAVENEIIYTYESDATKLYDLPYLSNNINVASLINYYQMLQVKDVIQQQYRTVPYRFHDENIKNIISLLDTNSFVLIGLERRKL
ncbi:MAG: hypothetical protein K2L10_08145 [Ruminococcus sp.]|nr:hypothetical protein [Ruminococcus sp.]